MRKQGMGRRARNRLLCEGRLEESSVIVAFQTSSRRRHWPAGTFLLRLHPECLPLVGRPPTEKMDEDSALRTPAVIGVWARQPVIKLLRRTHVAGGSRMARSRICEGCPRSALGMHVRQPYCPVCSLWGRICQRMRAGERLIPSWAGRIFTNRLRNLAARFGREGAKK